MAQVAEGDRARVAEAVESAIYPGLRRLRDFLVTDYEPKARQQPGISATPGGEAAYRLAIRMQTTLDETAEAVHAFGLADLEHIEAEMDEIAGRLGHADRHALRAALADDPANHTDDPDTIVRLTEEQTDRAYAAAPAYFGRLPSSNCVVKAVEPYREAESPPAFYMPPVARRLAPRPVLHQHLPADRASAPQLAAITFHEATPGHHFQLTIEMELQGMPAFRTLGGRMAGVAYSEGWGLYTERLADEMGLYASDAERQGMLEAQSFRAARLVVDSGLHAMGWTREQAITFMHERGSLPDGRRRDRGRPLHGLAGTGAGLQARSARDRGLARRGGRRDGGTVRSPRLPRRGARPRLAAADHAAARDPRLGRGRRRRLIRLYDPLAVVAPRAERIWSACSCGWLA